MLSFSPSQPDFTTGVTLSAKKKPNTGRGAERHAIRVVGVVVVRVAVVVHIHEVGAVGCIRRTQPPVRCTQNLQSITYEIH